MTEQPTQSPQNNRSLVTTLSVPLLLLSITALVVTFIVQILFYIPTQRTIVNTEQNLLAHEAADVVSGFIQAKFSEMEAVAYISNVVAASPTDQKRILENLLGLDHGIRQIILFDSVYRELSSVSRLSAFSTEDPVKKINFDVFVQVRQADQYVSKVYVDEGTGEPMVVMAVPIRDVFGDFQGLLLTEVNLKFMWELVAGLKVGENGFAYVVDKRGNLLAARDTSRVLSHENLNHIAIVRAFMTSSATEDAVSFMMQGINETQVVGTYLPLSDLDWAVVTELPWQEAFQEGTRALISIILVMIILAGIIGWAGLVLARRIAAPIITLTEISTRISRGELDLHAPVSGPKEISSLAASFNTMTAQLQQSLLGLTRRTRALETSQEVSRRLGQIFDERQLVSAVVREVQSAFNYYHAHIYLFDENQQNLVMVGGTGEAGLTMLAQGHKIPRGRGLVGRAAETQKTVLVEDVSEDKNWLPNPLLPETRAEIAVPIVAGEQVLGVLDVQHHLTGGLSSEDANLLVSIASQIAIALQNIRSYERTRRQAEQETLINTINQKIQQANTIEKVLQIAARELGQTIGANRTNIQVSLPRKVAQEKLS